MSTIFQHGGFEKTVATINIGGNSGTMDNNNWHTYFGKTIGWGHASGHYIGPLISENILEVLFGHYLCEGNQLLSVVIFVGTMWALLLIEGNIVRLWHYYSQCHYLLGTEIWLATIAVKGLSAKPYYVWEHCAWH